MISRLTKIQLVIFAIVTVLGGAFVGGRYAQIDRLVVDRSFPGRRSSRTPAASSPAPR